MKKLSVPFFTKLFVYSLLALTLFSPVSCIFGALTSVRVYITPVSLLPITMLITAVCTVVLLLISSKGISDRLRKALIIISPLSVWNAYLCAKPFYSITYVLVFTAFIALCLFISAAYGLKSRLKTHILRISVLGFLVTLFIFVMSSTIGQFGIKTVVLTIPCPYNSSYIEVIDSDQGALGGSTLIMYYPFHEISAGPFLISPVEKRIYIGRWGIYDKLEVLWQDEHEVLIDGTIYRV